MVHRNADLHAAPSYDYITSGHRRSDDWLVGLRDVLCFVKPKEYLGLPNIGILKLCRR